MGRQGVAINRLEGGLGRRNPNTDGHVLLVIQGAVATSKVPLKEVKKILSTEGAEALGIHPGYDDVNSILAHYHISEFFRISPDGTLYVVLDNGTLTHTELSTILKAESAIRAVGIVRNSNTMPADFNAVVAQYQGIVTALEGESRRIDTVFLEGVETDSSKAIADYPDLRALDARAISVVIGQDKAIRALKPAYTGHAAIGAALGAFSVRGVHENLGSINIENKPNASKGQRDYPLTDPLRDRFLSATLQNGRAYSDLSKAEIEELDTKGYVAIGNYNGYAGYFFTDSHTAIESASDYSRIENNRVWNKAARVLRHALLPLVKSNVLRDATTGVIAAVAVKELEGVGNAALEQMTAAGEISGAQTYIDPAQELVDDKPLHVRAEVVFNGILHSIEIDLGLTSKLSS